MNSEVRLGQLDLTQYYLICDFLKISIDVFWKTENSAYLEIIQNIQLIYLFIF